MIWKRREEIFIDILYFYLNGVIYIYIRIINLDIFLRVCYILKNFDVSNMLVILIELIGRRNI